jgi:hypothetical protein
VIAEECQTFRLFACGPIFSESKSEAKHRHSRDVVAALEKALADAMHQAGYEMLNEVKSRKPLDPELWRDVADTFRKHFPNLQHRAFRGEL